MLQMRNICKEYKTGNLVQKALDNVSLTLRDNEFVAILGPSGSGKTTFLNIIGGLDRYDCGDLIIHDISTKNYKDRDWDSYRNHTIGFVFQSYNLIPHQTILSNVELALTISGVSKNQRKQRAIEALKQVGLEKQIHKKPNQLSGGQMQRVAIARALVNNPDILLADEPTGALDSDTSIQVMELLKDVAKDRLVVMVTHNPELAEQYATRIVNLKDGKIQSDTNPYCVKEEGSKPEHKNMGKTSMSFWTSLQLSFNNLKTKKGRTFLTSFAGSIGIIGIALILSLSNGVNSYIKSVEEDTLSEYPLQIQKTGIDFSSMVMDTSNKDTKQGEIGVTKMLTNMFSTIGSNDLASLKQYIEKDENSIQNYAKAIEYSYQIVPQIYTANREEPKQLNPNTAFASLGLGSASSSNSMMSSMMSTDVFYQMPTNTSLFENQYNIKAGKWPEQYNECVLVLTTNGNISDFMLYTLGLREFEELEKMVEQFSQEEEVSIPEKIEDYSYEDILNVTFKLLNSTDYYEYDEEYHVWTNKKENAQYMKQQVEAAEELKIVGIVQPKEEMTATMLRSGIYYPSSLVDHIIQHAKESPIVKQQLQEPEINVFTGKRFDSDEQIDFDMQSLIQIDKDAMKSAFQIDSSKINVDFSNLNKAISQTSLPPMDLQKILSQIDFSISSSDLKNMTKDILEGYQNYMKKHPEADLSKIEDQLLQYLQSKEVSQSIQKAIEEAIKQNGEATITQEQMKQIISNVLKGYQDYVKQNHLVDITKLDQYIEDFLQSEEAKQVITNSLFRVIQSQKLDTQIAKIMEDYMKNAMSTMSRSLEKEMRESIQNMSRSIADAIHIDTNQFAKAIHMKMEEDELSELFASLMSKERNTYDGNLKKLGYARLEEPDSIRIYPKNFEGNEAILNQLNEYNERMRRDNKEEQVISYTDMVGTLMSSVTTIIDVVSYVLVAFVGISLLVSSIMIGVITYISVLERKKEIGILRAIGASKRNVAQVFNAETFMIGLLAGIIGIGVTLLLLIPTNQIIHMIAGQDNINAFLPFIPGIILILLSTVLTLIGGIIPSKKAAKEDPVMALRAE